MDKDEYDDLKKTMREAVIKNGLGDHSTIAAFERFTGALESIADNNVVDRGMGMGSCDFWVKIAGKEWVVEVKPISDGKPAKEVDDD